VGSVCRVKRLTAGAKRFPEDEEVETEVLQWLRQKSKDFYAASFDALVKRWDKCINVGGGYVEKCFSMFECHMFTFYINLCPIY
jgi:hypothetical protein